jgi:Raf kinase inhibitor-like YbhB/YbcL family protein
MQFKLTSTSFEADGFLPEAQLYNGMGQSGGNLSPALSWINPPDGTKSFAVTTYDPDAPTGSGWWHWVLVNIPATVSSLPEGASSAPDTLPQGALQSRTDFGTPGYGGAAPPPGALHHYVFTVHALSVETLPVNPDMSAAMVGFMINGARLGSASVTAVYGHGL